VRTPGEYDFSHLPGAMRMDLSDTPAVLGIMDKNETSFVICDTTGADSFPVAANLGQHRYSRVQVLEGGIFEWANKGLPLEGPTGPAKKVKSGGSRDAGLLNRRLRTP
jgi:rhodanese-related sulfurtransferase